MSDLSDRFLPARVLVDLYVRLRDEIDSGEMSLDPNHKLRAPIVMAILTAAEAIGDDILAIEASARQTLYGRAEPLAA